MVSIAYALSMIHVAGRQEGMMAETSTDTFIHMYSILMRFEFFNRSQKKYLHE